MSASGFLSHAEHGGATSERRVGAVVVVLMHVAVIAALLQIGEVRRAIADAAPIFVNFVTPEAEKIEAPPPPVIEPKKPPPRLIVNQRPTTVPTEFVVPPPPPEPVTESPAVEAPPVAAAPAASAAAPAPRLISHVEYVRPPAPEYPLMSRRFGEQGHVVVRVLINTQGRAERVELHQASPHRRLNEAALKAAQEALYRPYSENGVPQMVWALVPLAFELGR